MLETIRDVLVGVCLIVIIISTFNKLDRIEENTRSETVVTTTTTLPPTNVQILSTETDGMQRLVVDGVPCIKYDGNMTCNWYVPKDGK